MDIEQVKKYLKGAGIEVSEVIDNNKASEMYIRARFVQGNEFTWETVVPFYIRRSGLFINDEKELADYLKTIKPHFTEKGNVSMEIA